MPETDSKTKFGWSYSPFTLVIDPNFFVGYEAQVDALKQHIQAKHKMALVVGLTGSGKTTLLKWLETNMSDSMGVMYVSKPPNDPKEFVTIFTDTFGISWWERLLGRLPTLYTLPKYINKKMQGKQLLLMVDEAHETNKDVLEWFRILVDQIDNISIIVAGLPALEQKIKTDLETLDQRFTTRVNLNSLGKSETLELIKRRISSVGGTDIAPFTDAAIAKVYNRTGGFPREVLKMCDRLINTALEKDLAQIDAAEIEEEHREVTLPDVRVEQPTVSFTPRPPSEEQLAQLPYKQKKVLEILSEQDWLTPGTISERLGGTYATKGHAMRSVNNILHRLMLDGFVQRESRGKAFMYALSPKIRPHFVKS